MAKQDILWQENDGIFSYRVAGILLHAGNVLLQHAAGDPAYAFPGGHVALGETSQESLAREFFEEVGAEIRAVRLCWTGENFFSWDGRPCHQICLYYLVAFAGEPGIPLEGSFRSKDTTGVPVAFHWMPLSSLGEITVYPLQAQEKLANLSGQVEHFVYRED